MSEPCVCSCGEIFDLYDGNPCNKCGVIWCDECIKEPFNPCPSCKPDAPDCCIDCENLIESFPCRCYLGTILPIRKQSCVRCE